MWIFPWQPIVILTAVLLLVFVFLLQLLFHHICGFSRIVIKITVVFIGLYSPAFDVTDSWPRKEVVLLWNHLFWQWKHPSRFSTGTVSVKREPLCATDRLQLTPATGKILDAQITMHPLLQLDLLLKKTEEKNQNKHTFHPLAAGSNLDLQDSLTGHKYKQDRIYCY